MNTYRETIEGLKRELAAHVANLRSTREWADFLRHYRELCTIEELADAPKTSLEQLLGITPANGPNTFRQDAQKKSGLALGDQVESEPAAEIEKGS
ncbi:MAG: hypothetical protein LAO08_20890 [Acidobacteriia bacterium]|nr:hypothetical protein [Terriglobia bacterium]